MQVAEYREPIRILTKRNLRVKYRDSMLDFAWSLQILLYMMLIFFYLILSKILNDRFAHCLQTSIVAWCFLANGTFRCMMYQLYLSGWSADLLWSCCYAGKNI